MIAMTLFNIVCPDPEEAGKAVVIVPLVALEDQFGDAMERLGIRYLSLTSTYVETLEGQTQELQPLVLLANVESLNDSGIQHKISKLKLSNIAIDLAQIFCRLLTAAKSLLIFTQPTSLEKIPDLATASAVTGAVHSAPAPLPSTILIPPWQSCSFAKRQRSTCKNSFYHPHLAFVSKFLHTDRTMKAITADLVPWRTRRMMRVRRTMMSMKMREAKTSARPKYLSSISTDLLRIFQEICIFYLQSE